MMILLVFFPLLAIQVSGDCSFPAKYASEGLELNYELRIPVSGSTKVVYDYVIAAVTPDDPRFFSDSDDFQCAKAQVEDKHNFMLHRCDDMDQKIKLRVTGGAHEPEGLCTTARVIESFGPLDDEREVKHSDVVGVERDREETVLYYKQFGCSSFDHCATVTAHRLLRFMHYVKNKVEGSTTEERKEEL